MSGEQSPVAFQDAYVVSSIVTIIDDDRSLLRALGRLVRAAGFVVKTFTSAEEFLESDRSVPPRCLVLDMRLGGMDGFELHERLRASGTPPPVIFMTAHDDVASRDRAGLADGDEGRPETGACARSCAFHTGSTGRRPGGRATTVPTATTAPPRRSPAVSHPRGRRRCAPGGGERHERGRGRLHAMSSHVI